MRLLRLLLYRVPLVVRARSHSRPPLCSNYNYKLKAKQSPKTESVGYIVLEHQPQSCDELTSAGVVHWSNIKVWVNGLAVPHPKWVPMEESPKCGSKAVRECQIIRNARINR